jgi:hypothetical protein
MSDKKPSKVRFVLSTAVSAFIIVLATLLFLNRQYAVDQLSVWGYTPSSSIASIHDNMALNDSGTFYFYATHPRIDNSADFNADCPRQETGSPILGCYTGQRIFIYDVQNAQLNGVEEVTAAHEMLHAVWDRTSEPDKARIGKLLQAEYDKNQDAKFKERMDYYSRTEPGEFLNELHSIIGTEMKTISPELETYYKKYFTDRSVIIGYHEKYQAVFDDLSAQSDSLFTELKTLGDKIQTETAQYEVDVKALTADINTFNEKANNNTFGSQAEFNRERAALVVRTNALDATQTAINADIANYNVKYDTYQTLAKQIDRLNSSIDSLSNVTPVPAVQ